MTEGCELPLFLFKHHSNSHSTQETAVYSVPATVGFSSRFLICSQASTSARTINEQMTPFSHTPFGAWLNIATLLDHRPGRQCLQLSYAVATILLVPDLFPGQTCARIMWARCKYVRRWGYIVQVKIEFSSRGSSLMQTVVYTLVLPFYP